MRKRQRQPPAPAAPPTKTVRAVPNFVTVTDQMMRAPKPEDWLIHRGNYQAWGYSPLDQINKTQRQDSAAGLVARHGARHQPGHAARLQRRDVSRQSRRRDPGDRCRHRRPAVGVPAPAAAAPTSFRNNLGQRKRSIALYGDHIYTVTWDNFVVALDARTGKLVWQTRSRRRLLRQQLERPDRRQRRGRRGQHVPGRRPRLLRHRSRRHDRQGALAQRDDSAPGPARRRDLGRRAVREPLDDRRVGSAHLRSRARSRLSTDRAASAPPRRRSAEHAGRDHGRHQHALRRSSPRPAKSSGSTRCCRATIGIRNAPSK